MNEMEREYRESMRWYSKKWRSSHGEVLLDTLLSGAEAEGRDRPTTAEKRDLAIRGVADRLSGAGAFVLFALALFALVVLLAVIGAAPGASITLSLPAIPAPQPDQLYAPITTPVMTAGWVQLAAITVLVLCTAGGIVLLRRVRRMRSTTTPSSSH